MFKEFKNKFDLVTIGCSAGGIEALKFLLTDLSPDLQIPIVIIQHRGADSTSIFVKFFSDFCSRAVVEPEDKEPLQARHIYFAPASYHLLMANDKRFNLSIDEMVNYSCPSIDVFFISAASVFKDRLLGIVLTGSNADGADGLLEIKNQGGLTVVQDFKTTNFTEMPKAAIELVKPEYVLNLKEIQELLNAI